MHGVPQVVASFSILPRSLNFRRLGKKRRWGQDCSGGCGRMGGGVGVSWIQRETLGSRAVQLIIRKGWEATSVAWLLHTMHACHV